MKKVARIMVALTLIAAMLLTAGCSMFGKDPTKTSGKITFATWTWGVESANKMIEKFNEKYPNIKVEVVSFDGNVNDFLTTQAASNSLPDVAWGWENLNYPVSQGWLYPLDDFLKKDDETKYLPKTAMDSYKFGGKTYAVPWDVQFNSVLVNLDLIEQLNMDAPSYEWTVDEFKEYVTKATTDKYSGINHLWDFDAVMTGALSKDLHVLGFDAKENKYKLTSGSWERALALQKELKSVPGLVSDDLKNDALRNEGKEDDYQKKFGKDADALRESKVLLGFHGTWDYSWISTMPYKYDFYPLPQDPEVGYHNGVHYNHAFMLSTTKYPEAAFEFMKWMSYGKEGNLVNLDIHKNAVDAEGKPTPGFYIPATKHPEVLKAFEALDYVPEGIKYMLRNIDKSFRGDVSKYVPGVDKATWEVIFPKAEEIRAGKVEASAVAAELEQKANEVLAEAKTEFDKQLAEVQKKFPEMRKQIEESLKSESK